MTNELEEKVAALVESLPPLEYSVAQLKEVAAKPSADSAELAKVVETDSGLCATLLYLANCSCLRRANAPPVESIAEAMDRVGANTLAGMAEASAALIAIKRGLAPPAQQWRDYLQHSREISAICAILSEGLGHAPAEREMFTAVSLMHDIGRVVMFIAARNETTSLLGTKPEKMAEIVADEQTAYGLDHCRIGFALFRRWRFSPTMQQGILRHHSPLIGEDYCFSGALIFVSHFVTLSDFTGEIISRVLPAELLRRLNIGPRDLNRARHLYFERYPAR